MQSGNTWKKRYDRIIRIFQKVVEGKVGTPFEIESWNRQNYLFGNGNPRFKIVINNKNGLSALSQLNELKMCEAYMSGSIDIDGDIISVLSLRNALSDTHPLFYLWRRILPVLIGEVPTNKRAISSHYEFDNDFYLTFMDRSRCYSHALFSSDDESLEDAQRRKLDFAVQSCNLKEGDRVLDVGGGWGTFTEYAGKKGIHVTSLTIAKQSEKYLHELIEKEQLPCNVINRDFLEFESPEPYDGIVVLGVIEHLPNYPAVLKQFQRLLKPGGRVYLDASSDRHKYSQPGFIARYIFPGGHSCLCLHDFLNAVAKTDIDVLAVYNDRHSYYLTTKAWAENLEASKDEIIKKWGEMLYRRFRLYLWGTTNAFQNRTLDAYRVILEKPVI